MTASLKHTKTLLATAALIALTACGGGGGGGGGEVMTPPVVAAAAEGVMVDGYVSGATVFCDQNGNNVLDNTEESTTTSAFGAYKLSKGCDSSVVGTGGINIDTGFPFKGLLKAPAGSTVITPLTTMLVSSGLSKAALASLLNLPVSTDVSRIDPGQNADLLKKTLFMHQVIDGLTRATLAKTGGVDAAKVYESVASDVAKALANQSTSTQLVSAAGDVDLALFGNLLAGLPAVIALNLVQSDRDAAIASLASDAQIFLKATTAELLTIVKQLQDPVRPPVVVDATTRFLSMTDDAVSINGTSTSLSSLDAGVTVNGLSAIGFNLSVAGATPSTVTVPMALQIVEQSGGQDRVLDMMIDKVTVKIDDQKAVSIVVPDDAKVYAYGHTANGTDINLTLNDLVFAPITVTNNGLSLNYANMVKKVVGSAGNTTQTTAAKFIDIKGSFAIRVVVGKELNVRRANATALPTQTIAIPNTPQSVTGPSFNGKLTIN